MGAKSSCGENYVQVIEYTQHGDEIVDRQYCGSESIAAYKSKTNKVAIKLVQNVNFSGTGWQLRFVGITPSTPVEAL